MPSHELIQQFSPKQKYNWIKYIKIDCIFNKHLM